MAEAAPVTAPWERSTTFGLIGRYGLLAVIAFVVLFPIYTTIVAALKPGNRVLVNPLVPDSLTLDVLRDAWTEGRLGRYLLNSVVVAVFVTIGQVVTSLMAAYAFAMLRFPGRNVLFVVFLATLLVPLEATVVVNRLTIDSLGWLNSYQGLVVPFLASAFGIFLLRQALMSLPKDLRDAALIDGVGHVGFLRHVAVPLLRPTLGALALFTFLGTWNAYLWPNLITTEEDWNTVQIGLRQLKAQALDAPNLRDGRDDHRGDPDRRRSAGLPATIDPRSHGRSSQGMNFQNRSATATPRRRSLRHARRLRVGTVDPPRRQRRHDDDQAGGSGRRRQAPESAADDDLPRRAVRRRRRRRRRRRAADDDPAGDAAADAGGPSGFAGAPGVTVQLAGNPDFAACPVDALESAERAGAHHVLAHDAVRRRRRLGRPDRRVQRQPGPRRRRAAEPERLRGADRQVLPVERRGPTAPHPTPGVHAPADGRHQHGGDDDGVHPGRRLRHLAVPAPGDVRLPDRRCAVGDAVQHLDARPLLPTGHVRGGRPRSRHLADHPRRRARVLAANRRLRRGDLRHRPRFGRQLRWRLVRRALAGPRRAAVRRQRQRQDGPGDAGAVQHARDGGDADVRPGSRRPTISPSTSAKTHGGSTGCCASPTRSSRRR